MKAIAISDSKLIWTNSPDLKLKANQVLLQVRCAGINRADLLQRAGKYPPPPGESEVLGMEVSGDVVEKGSEITAYPIGTRVMTLLAGGGYAEYVAVDANQLIELPENLSYEDGAAIPEAFIAAYLNLFYEHNVRSGQNVLVHAAASGVGIAATQMLHHVGAIPFGTAGTDEKCAAVKRYGAALCVNYKTESIVEVFEERIGAAPFDFILNMVGASNIEGDLRLLKRNGCCIVLSLMSGRQANLDLAVLLAKNITLKGSTLRSRSKDEKATIKDAFVKDWMPVFVAGKIRPAIDSIFPIERASEAHAHMAANKNIGKVILKVS